MVICGEVLTRSYLVRWLSNEFEIELVVICLCLDGTGYNNWFG